MRLLESVRTSPRNKAVAASIFRQFSNQKLSSNTQNYKSQPSQNNNPPKKVVVGNGNLLIPSEENNIQKSDINSDLSEQFSNSECQVSCKSLIRKKKERTERTIKGFKGNTFSFVLLVDHINDVQKDVEVLFHLNLLYFIIICLFTATIFRMI
jgi:hypothetical protein